MSANRLWSIIWSLLMLLSIDLVASIGSHHDWQVQTRDGFLLGLQHIPHGLNEMGLPSLPNKPPVFLQHGVLQVITNKRKFLKILCDDSHWLLRSIIHKGAWSFCMFHIGGSSLLTFLTSKTHVLLVLFLFYMLWISYPEWIAINTLCSCKSSKLSGMRFPFAGWRWLGTE